MKRTVICFLLAQFYNTLANNHEDIHLHINLGNNFKNEIKFENENRGRGLNFKLAWFNKTTLKLKIENIEIENRWMNIRLTPATSIPGLNTPCLYEGKLEGDPKTMISVSGCPDKETSVAIGFPFGVVYLTLVDGITKNLDDEPIAVDLKKSRDYSVGNIDYSTADYLHPPTDPFEIAAVWLGPIPSTVVLKTNIKYDNSLLEHFDNSHEKTADWINGVVELAKPKLSHNSLTIKVVLEIGEVSHIDETLEASEDRIYDLAQKRQRTLTSYFCKDIGGGVLGIAYVGAACHSLGYAVNINELYSTTSPDIKTAKTFAHELGHNIGMLHDFDEEHGGRKGKCNGLGLMSYGEKRPDKWSSCSDTDFKKWWEKKGHDCVKKSDLQVPNDEGCPSGWSQLSTGCYFVKESPMNWEESKKFCSEHQAEMVIIENEEERREISHLVRDLLKKKLRLWLGVRNVDGVWETNKGKKFSFFIHERGIGDCLNLGAKVYKAVCRHADMPWGYTFNPFCKKPIGAKI